jgi:hypothetical protein
MFACIYDISGMILISLLSDRNHTDDKSECSCSCRHDLKQIPCSLSLTKVLIILVCRSILSMNISIISDLFLLGSSGHTRMTSKLHFDIPVPSWHPPQDLTKLDEGEVRKFLRDIIRLMLLLCLDGFDVRSGSQFMSFIVLRAFGLCQMEVVYFDIRMAECKFCS